MLICSSMNLIMLTAETTYIYLKFDIVYIHIEKIQGSVKCMHCLYLHTNIYIDLHTYTCIPAYVHLEYPLFQKLMIDEKKCYLFGRNPQLNDFCIDHASCSRVHCSLVYHKHLNMAFLVDLGSSKFMIAF